MTHENIFSTTRRIKSDKLLRYNLHPTGEGFTPESADGGTTAFGQ
jgi:hypothetical protein